MASTAGPRRGVGDTDPDPRLRREFWTLVVIFDLAILAGGTGLLLLVFGVRESMGWLGVAVGVAAFAYGFGRYRRRSEAG